MGGFTRLLCTPGPNRRGLLRRRNVGYLGGNGGFSSDCASPLGSCGYRDNRGLRRLRLPRLKSRAVATDRNIKIRFGYVKRLPPDYKGERHIIIGRHLPKQGDREWVEFEELPGPVPAEQEEPRQVPSTSTLC